MPGGNDQNTTLLLHADSDFEDSSDFSQTLSTTGNDVSLTAADKKFGAKSMSFGGTDAVVKFADASQWDLAGDFAIDMWINFDTDSRGFFVAHGTNSSNMWWFEYDKGGTSLRFRADSGSSKFVEIISDSFTANINTWDHIAITRFDTDYRIFINGTVSGSTQTSGTVPIFATADLIIGMQAGGGINFNGEIDELRISNTGRYGSDFTVATAAYTKHTQVAAMGVAGGYWGGGIR